MNQASDVRVNFNEIDDNIFEYIAWQGTLEGREIDLPRIEESHKEILSTAWEIRLKQEEEEVSRAINPTNNIIQTINDNLHNANLIQEFPPGSLLDIRVLERQWRETSKAREGAIKQLTKIDWEVYWRYLVKPHNQWLMLCFLVDSSTHMLPTLSDAVYTGKLHMRKGQPHEFNLMMDIYELIQ